SVAQPRARPASRRPRDTSAISAACNDRRLALLPPEARPPEEVQVMREVRWLLRVAPPFAALAAVVALGSASLRSTAMAAGCGGQSLAAATRVAPPAPRAVAGAAAFVIAPLLDASGTL